MIRHYYGMKKSKWEIIVNNDDGHDSRLCYFGYERRQKANCLI